MAGEVRCRTGPVGLPLSKQWGGAEEYVLPRMPGKLEWQVTPEMEEGLGNKSQVDRKWR